MLLINLAVFGSLLVSLYNIYFVNKLQKRLQNAEFALLELIFENDPELAEQHKELREWINAKHD
jgi:uncharacterized protein YgfB (UPF0149 family)